MLKALPALLLTVYSELFFVKRFGRKDSLPIFAAAF